jgi:hypothetical protein
VAAGAALFSERTLKIIHGRNFKEALEKIFKFHDENKNSYLE